MGNEAHINKLQYGKLDGKGHLHSIGIGRNMILNLALMK
jgi:hypothetical protein